MDASQSRDSLKAVLLFFSALLFALAVRPGPQSAWLVLMGTVLIGVLTLSPSRASAPFVVDSQERWSFRLLMAVLAFGLLGVVGWVPSTIGPTTAQLERVPGAVWCLLALATFVTRRRANDVMRWGLVVLAVALTLAVGALHLRAAHGVGFDVLVFHIEAAQALAEGQNPWTDAVTVPDGSLNAEPGDVIVGYVYPPVTAIAYSVGYWVFSDPRVTSLLAWTGYLLVLGALAIRRRSTPGLLTMLLFAALPGWPLVLRAAWSEPLSLVLLAGAYAMWRSSAGSGLTTGLAMASKQYFFATAPLLLLHRDARWKSRLVIAVSMIVVTIGAAVVWDPIAFWDAAVRFHLSTDPRPDGANLVGLASLFGLTWEPPGFLALAVGLVVGVLAGRHSSTRRSFMLGMGVTLAASFLFGSQAFVNYWFLIAGICGLVLADVVSSEPEIKLTAEPFV
jgi:hypothetical protein